MFQSTFSFWRRLVGKHVPSPYPAEQAERRLWVRYAADMSAQVQPALPEAHENRLPARVRDISQGGVNLLVEQSFETGRLLSLELSQAGDEETRTVLACVVRVEPEGPGRWELGCVFARELSDEDLQGFGAKRVRPPASDKRNWKRFNTSLRANFQKIGDPESRIYHAQVINVSASGVGLLVPDAIDAGALLNLDLIGAQDQVIRTILACVVHVSHHASGDWALGCNFIREFNEEDLKALLG